MARAPPGPDDRSGWGALDASAAVERALACDPGFLPALVLRESAAGRPEEEIRGAILAGEEVTRLSPRPLLAFSGDTGAGVFASAPREAFEAKVLLLECSFVEPEDLRRARDYGHLHVDDVAERADLFANEALVLTHLTLRSTPGELRRTIARRLPASLAARTVLFLPPE